MIDKQFNEERSEEGNYNRIVDQDKPQVIRRKNLDEGVDRNGCKYKDFMTSNQVFPEPQNH